MKNAGRRQVMEVLVTEDGLTTRQVEERLPGFTLREVNEHLLTLTRQGSVYRERMDGHYIYYLNGGRR